MPTMHLLATDKRLSPRPGLYVGCQLAGWGAWTLVYLGLLFAQGEVLVDGKAINRQPGPKDIALVLAINCIGLLVTHGYRAFIHRRGWSRLSPKALLPRIAGASLALGTVWTAVAWPLVHVFMGRTEETVQINPATVTLYSVFNGAVLLFGWSALYFGYHIFESYRRSEIERWQLQSTAKEAELQALKSQVNPHFIFNSLNSLRALIDENPAQARDAVTRLANLLRYSLKAGQLETVPLEDELRIVDDYLALEQVRHEDRLRVRVAVSPEAAAAPVPPMLVQTLVENSVKYGIARCREGGEVAIEARCTADRLLLRITNPGSLSSDGGSTGLGLRNAAQRLRLIFGERARLQVTEESPGLVVAAVELPLAPVLPAASAPRAVSSVP
jgi:hypothetical protein